MTPHTCSCRQNHRQHSHNPITRSTNITPSHTTAPRAWTGGNPPGWDLPASQTLPRGFLGPVSICTDVWVESLDSLGTAAQKSQHHDPLQGLLLKPQPGSLTSHWRADRDLQAYLWCEVGCMIEHHEKQASLCFKDI